MTSDNKHLYPDLLAGLFRILSQSARIEILLTIGTGEACVCHLEAILGLRQAYISQQMMALRDADILTSRREGRFVFYRLADERLLSLIQSAAVLLGMEPQEAAPRWQNLPVAGCGCPHCSPDSDFVTVFENFDGPATASTTQQLPQ